MEETSEMTFGFLIEGSLRLRHSNSNNAPPEYQLNLGAQANGPFRFDIKPHIHFHIHIAFISSIISK